MPTCACPVLPHRRAAARAPAAPAGAAAPRTAGSDSGSGATAGSFPWSSPPPRASAQAVLLCTVPPHVRPMVGRFVGSITQLCQRAAKAHGILPGPKCKQSKDRPQLFSAARTVRKLNQVASKQSGNSTLLFSGKHRQAHGGWSHMARACACARCISQREFTSVGARCVECVGASPQGGRAVWGSPGATRRRPAAAGGRGVRLGVVKGSCGRGLRMGASGVCYP